MPHGLIALCLSLAAVTCLYLSWQKRGPRQPWLVPAGWLAAVAATAFWIVRSGAEYGTVYALLVLPLLGWLAVLYNLEIKRKKQRIAENLNFVVPTTRSLLRHLTLFIVALPLSAIASTYFTVALFSLLPGTLVNLSVSIVFIAPVVWGLAAYWVCADARRFRPALCISAAGLLGAAIVHF